MRRTIEVDAAGGIQALLPKSKLPRGCALLKWQMSADHQTASLSEAALAVDWLRPEEDAVGSTGSRPSSPASIPLLRPKPQ